MDNKELEEYLIEIHKTPLLSIEEEIELSKAVQQKGADCDEMKKLVKCNERFVMSVARVDKGWSRWTGKSCFEI